MPNTLFISDLHLSNRSPNITSGFLKFLNNEARYVDALYILGDLFDYWIGDDDPNPLYEYLAFFLRRLSIPCHFLHGNRDFLLGKHFACRAGINLIPNECVLEIYGQRLLIMHGDTLCVNDIFYQLYRKIVQCRWMKNLFLTIPIYTRQHIASIIRVYSKKINNKKKIETMDVHPQLVTDIMRAYRVSILIHGHTHRPAVHQLEIHGYPAQRLVLGDWHQYGSMVRVSHNDIQLVTFSL
ncbi:UDP-2,3-diacylglucosamine diphosphatase [Candidatus Erwinia haradaeae]|uniref:UDP-2,3-diacylglucosamine hydrolase n=1 Tax=Candidatus Erwinia haradaeae TaxID=1922217 RepID=A0A451DM67_9GAMM|nr:UDP-2,3-diacylglucosamine diphosphatase [Candidatus Erwinia haradaeae]VFP87840.1 UDP-2,3-diacylglucosamine hydrolase [Candidatus Erwinia haradaeae]